MEKGRTPTWKWCSVRSVADVNPETPLPHGAMSVPYYGMAAIDESTGELREPDMVGLDGALRGKSKFQNGDVLFARISPCVQNRKSALAQGIPGNFALGSSEFYVLRPKRSISAEYLFYFLRQQEIVDSAVANLTGTSGRQRVPGSFWDTVTIPVPPVPVQQRIVQILRKADEIYRKRRKAWETLEAIRRSLFIEVFGDPGSNPKGWRIAPLSELLDPAIERVNPSKAFPDRKFTYIEIGSVENFRIVEVKHLLGAEAPSRARQVVRTGDVLYSMTRPNLRNIAVVTEEHDGAICTTGFAVLRPKNPDDSAFIFEIVKSDYFTAAMARLAEEKSLYPAVDEQQVRQFPVVCPDPSVRAYFGTVIARLLSVSAPARAGIKTAETLARGLLSRAFTGELTAEWEEANAAWILEQQALFDRLPRLVILAMLLERAKRTRRTTAEILVTALMKYVFLLQMEGSAAHRWFYHYVPYHYGPFAKELYRDLEALSGEGLIQVHADREEEKTRITLADLSKAEKLVASLPEDLKQDATAIIDAYGGLTHNALLETVYEKYPAYARKSRFRGSR